MAGPPRVGLVAGPPRPEPEERPPDPRASPFALKKAAAEARSGREGGRRRDRLAQNLTRSSPQPPSRVAHRGISRGAKHDRGSVLLPLRQGQMGRERSGGGGC